jgi:hypothetical protein
LQPRARRRRHRCVCGCLRAGCSSVRVDGRTVTTRRAAAPPPPQVLAAAAPAAVACLPRFNTGMLADLLWSYAAVGVRDEALVDAVAQVCACVRLCACVCDQASCVCCRHAGRTVPAARAWPPHTPRALLLLRSPAGAGAAGPAGGPRAGH